MHSPSVRLPTGHDRAVLAWALFPPDKPNHLLGIADGESIDRAVPWGVDTFDSCYPTRVARHGHILTRQGVIRLRQGKYKVDHGPIDEECRCSACREAGIVWSRVGTK